MLTTFRLILFILIGTMLCVQVQAQSGSQIDFESEGVSFSHLAGWTVKEETSPEFRYFMLTKPGSSDRLMIIVKRDPTLRSELPAAMLKFTEQIVKDAANQLGNETKQQQIPITATVGTVEADGVRLKKGARVTDIVWLRTRLRLVAVVAMGGERSQAVSSLWETVLGSLKLDPPVLGTMIPAAKEPEETKKAELLNGRAVALPKPPYPAVARMAKVSGTVSVQVIIDESGNVISARAISGHPLLYAVCVTAAREARFSPTRLDGEPVRVTGVIQYNFVAQ